MIVKKKSKKIKTTRKREYTTEYKECPIYKKCVMRYASPMAAGPQPMPSGCGSCVRNPNNGISFTRKHLWHHYYDGMEETKEWEEGISSKRKTKSTPKKRIRRFVKNGRTYCDDGFEVYEDSTSCDKEEYNARDPRYKDDW